MKIQALTANYNSVEYLAETLRSAVEDNQIPVLLVDDGSTDGSDALAEGFPEVTVFRQANVELSYLGWHSLLSVNSDQDLEEQNVLRRRYEE